MNRTKETHERIRAEIAREKAAARACSASTTTPARGPSTRASPS